MFIVSADEFEVCNENNGRLINDLCWFEGEVDENCIDVCSDKGGNLGNCDEAKTDYSGLTCLEFYPDAAIKHQRFGSGAPFYNPSDNSCTPISQGDYSCEASPYPGTKRLCACDVDSLVAECESDDDCEDGLVCIDDVCSEPVHGCPAGTYESDWDTEYLIGGNLDIILGGEGTLAGTSYRFVTDCETSPCNEWNTGYVSAGSQITTDYFSWNSGSSHEWIFYTHDDGSPVTYTGYGNLDDGPAAASWSNEFQQNVKDAVYCYDPCLREGGKRIDGLCWIEGSLGQNCVDVCNYLGGNLGNCDEAESSTISICRKFHPAATIQHQEFANGVPLYNPSDNSCTPISDGDFSCGSSPNYDEKRFCVCDIDNVYDVDIDKMCESDADCETGLNCLSGICSEDMCESDDDCETGYACESGLCTLMIPPLDPVMLAPKSYPGRDHYADVITQTPEFVVTYDDTNGNNGEVEFRIATSEACCIAGTNIVSSSSVATTTAHEDVSWVTSILSDGRYHWCAKASNNEASTEWVSMGHLQVSSDSKECGIWYDYYYASGILIGETKYGYSKGQCVDYCNGLEGVKSATLRSGDGRCSCHGYPGLMRTQYYAQKGYLMCEPEPSYLFLSGASIEEADGIYGSGKIVNNQPTYNNLNGWMVEYDGSRYNIIAPDGNTHWSSDELDGEYTGQTSGPMYVPLPKYPVDSCPTVITESGIYEIEERLSADETCITVAADTVIINGYGRGAISCRNKDINGIEVNGREDVQVFDLEINSCNNAIKVSGSELIGLTRNRLYHNTVGTVFESRSTGIWVEKNTISFGGKGVHIDNCETVTLADKNIIEDNDRDAVFIRGSKDIKLESNIIKRNSNGVVTTGGSDYKLLSNQITDNNKNMKDDKNGNGVDILWGNEVELNKNVIKKNGRYGVKIYVSHNLKLEDNDIIDNDIDGINARQLEDSNILKNDIMLNTVAGISVYDESHNNKIIENILKENQDGIILKDNSNHNELTKNEISNEHETGITVADCSRNSLMQNKVAGCTKYGFKIERGHTNILSNSEAHRNLRGIVVSGTRNNKVWHNNLLKNSRGIEIVKAQHNLLQSNKVLRSKENGIVLLRFSKHNTIDDNDASDGEKYGFVAGPLTSDNIIKNNRFERNKEAGASKTKNDKNNYFRNSYSYNEGPGIELLDSNNNQFVGNFIEWNQGVGVSFVNSAGNYFYDNLVCYNVDTDISSNLADVNNGDKNTCTEATGYHDKSVTENCASYCST